MFVCRFDPDSQLVVQLVKYDSDYFCWSCAIGSDGCFGCFIGAFEFPLLAIRVYIGWGQRYECSTGQWTHGRRQTRHYSVKDYQTFQLAFAIESRGFRVLKEPKHLSLPYKLDHDLVERLSERWKPECDFHKSLGAFIPVGLVEQLLQELHEMQMRLATNMICRWTLREYRWKLKWRRSINSVLHELRALPPSKSFWGGIDYLEAERDWQKRCVQ